MDDKLIKETADELDLTHEQVKEVIKSMETLIHQSLITSNEEEYKEVRVMGFGSFEIISDKAIDKINKAYDKIRDEVSRDEPKADECVTRKDRSRS